MDIDPNTILNALVAILGAGGVYGGGRVIYNRVQASRQAAAQADSDFGPINTGQVPAIVSASECNETRKGLNDSIHEVRSEVKEGLERQSGQLTKLSDSVTEIKEALARQEGNVLKAVGFGIREHEGRFHGGSK